MTDDVKKALDTLAGAITSARGRSALNTLREETEAADGRVKSAEKKTFGGKTPPKRSAKGEVHSSAPFAKRMARGQGTATARGGSK